MTLRKKKEIAGDISTLVGVQILSQSTLASIVSKLYVVPSPKE
jgi:hypothetical protein